MGAYGDDDSSSPDALQIDNKPLQPLAPHMPPPQAGPSRLGHQPRLSAPSPSIRGSAAPRRSESPIDIDSLPDNFGPDDVKPRYKRSRDGDENREIDLHEGEVKDEQGVVGVDPEDEEVAELEKRLAEAKKKAIKAKAARISAGGGVKTETKVEQPSSQFAAGGGSSAKGKERAHPIEVIDLTGDDD